MKLYDGGDPGALLLILARWPAGPEDKTKEKYEQLAPGDDWGNKFYSISIIVKLPVALLLREELPSCSALFFVPADRKERLILAPTKVTQTTTTSGTLFCVSSFHLSAIMKRDGDDGDGNMYWPLARQHLLSSKIADRNLYHVPSASNSPFSDESASRFTSRPGRVGGWACGEERKGPLNCNWSQIDWYSQSA